MWKWIAAGVAVLLIGAGIYGFYSGAVSLGVNGGACRENDEISDADRRAIGTTAMALVRAIIAKDDAAYGMMTAQARSLTPRAKFAEFLTAASKQGSFANPAVGDLYLLDTVGSGEDARAICGAVSGDQWVSVAVRPGLRQAYAEVTAQTRNDSWTFTIWLLPEAGGWRVTDVRLNMSAASGLNARDLLTMARRERDAGHAFNATMLYEAAIGTVGRGPAMQLGIEQTIRQDTSAFTAPPELQGKPPFTWTLGGKPYKVAQVTILGIEKKLGLIFILPRTSWGTNEEIDADNRQFLDGFRAAHPEYDRAFGFLVARAIKPDNSGGFGTVYRTGKGY